MASPAGGGGRAFVVVPRDMRALTPGKAFVASLTLLKARPWPALLLGAALATSMLSVACGIGVFAAAWFLCELFALQISVGTGTRVARTRAWLWAGFVQVLAVLVLSSILGVCLVAMGPDVFLAGLRGDAQAFSNVSTSLVLLSLVGSLMIMLTVCFEHAPAILVDRGGGPIVALMESARVVTTSGTLRTWATSVAAHGLQMAPLVVGMTLASTAGSLDSVPYWAVALGPFGVLCLVLGQGMLVASYLSLRDEVTDPQRIPKSASPSKLGATLWSLLLCFTISGPLLVAGALARPSVVSRGVLDTRRTVLTIQATSDGTQENYIPDTALLLKVNPRSVRVSASDGGGVGKLPLPKGQVSRVRVARAEPQRNALAEGTLSHAIEIELATGAQYLTYVDEAGVRLDDTVTRRLRLLLPAWGYAALILCLIWTAVWIARALPPQARLRRQLAESAAQEGQDDAAAARLRAAFRRGSIISAIWLFPAAISSLWIGLWAVWG